MEKRKNRTMDEYKKAGAVGSLLNALLSKFLVNSCTVMNQAEKSKIYKAIALLTDVRSSVEDRMLVDHPELGDDYIDVFYGGLSKTSGRSIPAEEREIVESVIAAIMADFDAMTVKEVTGHGKKCEPDGREEGQE